MSRNGSGTYNLPVNSWNPAVNGVPATAADWQAVANDLAAALTQSISKDGQTPITSTIPFADITVVNFSYSGTLTGGTGVLNIGSGQIYKSSGGIIGIGTATPTAIGSNITTIELNGTEGGGVKFTKAGVAKGSFYSSNDEVLVSNETATGNFRVFVNGAEAARIPCATGNLLMGTTSSTINARVVSYRTTAALTCFASWNADTSGDNQFHTFATEAGGTARGAIDYNRAGGLTRYNTTSDGTLKNIKGPADLSASMDLIMSIPIDEWAWKEDENQWSQVGPIAQKLHAVFPGAVSVGGEYEQVIPAVTDPETGEIIEPAYTETKYRPWAVDKTAPTWHLVAACQYLNELVDEQKNYIDSILARLEAIEQPLR